MSKTQLFVLKTERDENGLPQFDTVPSDLTSPRAKELLGGVTWDTNMPCTTVDPNGHILKGCTLKKLHYDEDGWIVGFDIDYQEKITFTAEEQGI